MRAPDTPLVEGMFFTIEPMICAGKPDMRVLKGRLDGGDSRTAR